MQFFPSYETTFLCDCSLQEATKRIAEAAACEANEMKIVNASYCAGTQRIVLHAKWFELRHLTTLVSTLEIKETEQRSMVSAIFSERKYTKVCLLVSLSIFMLCWVSYLSFYLAHEITVIWPLFGSVLALLYGWWIYWNSFELYASKLLRILHPALTLEFVKQLPALNRCRFFRLPVDKPQNSWYNNKN